MKKSPLPRSQPLFEDWAISAQKVPFNPLDDVWRIHNFGAIQHLHFQVLRDLVEPELFVEIKRVFRVLAENRNPRTCGAALSRTKSTARLWKKRSGKRLAEISPAMFASVLAEGADLRLWPMILKVWSAIGADLMTADALDYVQSISNRQGREKHNPLQAVRTRDPKKGPYHPAEDQVISTALTDAYLNGELSLRDYALMRIFRGLGIRSSQVAMLTVSDFEKKNGRYFIQIPMAKQRGSTDRGRFMKPKALSLGLAKIIEQHIQENCSIHGTERTKSSDPALFQSRKTKEHPGQMQSHMHPDHIRRIYRRVFKQLAIKSPITGKLIEGRPNRDRHTYLTTLAMAGCTAEQIASQAGHASPASCQAYVDMSIDHFQRMENGVGQKFVPVADRFLGQVVANEVEASPAGERKFIVRDESFEGVGSCGMGGCSAIDTGSVPFACYTCRKFRAWDDAPHEVILERLCKEQKELVKQGHKAVAETKTGTIIAITDLMEAIRIRKDSDQ